MKPYNLHFVTGHIIERLQSRLRAAVWTVVSGVFSKCFSECQEREHVSGISGPLVLESADLLPGVMKVKKQPWKAR